MKKFAVATLFSLAAFAVCAEVDVADPWVRATVPQQKATGAFMRLTSDRDARLLSAVSPIAGTVEIHKMVMEGTVMKMAPIANLELPAGQAVELKPGGYHVMLLELKGQVKEGDSVPLSLVVEDADGKRQTVQLEMPVRPLNAAAGAGMQHKH